MDRWWYIAPLLVGLLGCPKPHPPTPTPTPPPEPTIQHPELLLRQNAGNLSRNGQPHLLFGSIPCWDPLEKDHGGWAGFDSKWVDYSVAKGANIFHMRVGPFKKDNPAEDGTEWPNGLMYQMGPYVDDDSTKGFNQAWWDRALSMVRYAESKGANAEIDLIDGWACKHAQWGDFQMPWNATDIQACGNHLTETHKQFLRKTVETFGCEGGVIWQDGNELGQIEKYAPAWSLGMVDAVRQYEQEVGCGLVHMFGTCSENDEVEQSPKVDYSTTHQKTGITGPWAGKFRQNNEHNPPFSPQGEQYMYCKARNVGQAWWYWRGGQSQDDMETTLNLFAKGCEGVATEGCPFPVKPTSMLRCKRHGSHGGYPLYDCTPLGLNGNPIWPEGDAELRTECELKSMGGLPDFFVGAPLSVHHLAHGGMAFAVAGSGSAPVTCSIPKEPAGYRGCVDANGAPFVVTQ